MDCVLGFLPEEMIREILKRLPVKSLIRFRCVCKHWKNLIKNPSFIQEHLHNSTQQNPSLLIHQGHGFDDPFSLCLLDCKMQFHEVVDTAPLFGSLSCISIVGSSNGLLCLADSSVRPHAPLLWNPATREVKRVPMTFKHYLVICDFGFGFSPIINDYKIVRIVRFSLLHMSYIVEVYSLRTGSWRNIRFDEIEDICINHHGVTVNGVMFWMGLRLLDGDRGDVIVSFDIASEVFTITPWPVSLSHQGIKLELAAYEDKLAIISSPGYINYRDCYICFGVMEEIGSSAERWSLGRTYIRDFYRLNLEIGTIWRNLIVCSDFEWRRYISEPKGEKDNVEPKFDLYLINVVTNKHEVFAIPERPGHFLMLFNYVESLVPVGEP